MPLPALFNELAKDVDLIFVLSKHWKRLRIAVTREELHEYREYIRERGEPTFHQAIRAIPLFIEPYPTHFTYVTEPLNAQLSKPSVQ